MGQSSDDWSVSSPLHHVTVFIFNSAETLRRRRSLAHAHCAPRPHAAPSRRLFRVHHAGAAQCWWKAEQQQALPSHLLSLPPALSVDQGRPPRAQHGLGSGPRARGWGLGFLIYFILCFWARDVLTETERVDRHRFSL